MLIGTAVVGATTMIFSIVVLLTHGLTDNMDRLSILHPPFLLGMIMGGAVIFWFTGASSSSWWWPGDLPRGPSSSSAT